jgi:hypothetical protein
VRVSVVKAGRVSAGCTGRRVVQEQRPDCIDRRRDPLGPMRPVSQLAGAEPPRSAL